MTLYSLSVPPSPPKHTQSQVFLLGHIDTFFWERARTAGVVTALARLLQPGLVALDSLQGHRAAAAGVVDASLPQLPPHVHPHMWQRAQQLLARKEELLQQREEGRQAAAAGTAAGAAPRSVQKAQGRLLTLVEQELASALMQARPSCRRRGMV